MAENLALVERYYELFNRGDLDEAMQLFDPDLVTIDPASGEMRGVAAFRAYGETFRRAMPDARLNLVRAAESSNLVAIEGSFTGTHSGPLASPQGDIPPTGRHIDLPYTDVFDVRAGRIVSHHVYYDQMALLGMLGLLPQPAAV